jgi:hypothetical protein
MTIHPNTPAQRHETPADPRADHDIAPTVARTDPADHKPVLNVDVDREEIVPLGRRSPRPRPQTPPHYPWQPQIVVAATIAAFVGMTITTVVLLVLLDTSKPRHDSSRVSPTIAANSPDAVARPHQAAAMPRPLRQQGTLAAQRHAQQHQHARRVAAQRRARDRHVAQRNRRAVAQHRRLAMRNARARATAWRRAQTTSRRSTSTRTPSHLTRRRDHHRRPVRRAANLTCAKGPSFI